MNLRQLALILNSALCQMVLAECFLQDKIAGVIVVFEYPENIGILPRMSISAVEALAIQ